MMAVIGMPHHQRYIDSALAYLLMPAALASSSYTPALAAAAALLPKPLLLLLPLLLVADRVEAQPLLLLLPHPQLHCQISTLSLSSAACLDASAGTCCRYAGRAPAVQPVHQRLILAAASRDQPIPMPCACSQVASGQSTTEQQQ
jgi:hypothetical protein